MRACELPCRSAASGTKESFDCAKPAIMIGPHQLLRQHTHAHHAPRSVDLNFVTALCKQDKACIDGIFDLTGTFLRNNHLFLVEQLNSRQVAPQRRAETNGCTFTQSGRPNGNLVCELDDSCSSRCFGSQFLAARLD